jgi:hypothetical protein
MTFWTILDNGGKKPVSSARQVARGPMSSSAARPVAYRVLRSPSSAILVGESVHVRTPAKPRSAVS